jgi:hypothetical protein
MSDILGRYGTEELRVIADFLNRTVGAGRHAADELAAGKPTER